MYEDKTLICKECGAEFVFTAGEQEFYAEKGFTNEPQRCKACRAARKTIEDIVFEPVVGALYYGEVKRVISNLGAFVELAPGKDAMCHIKDLEFKRTEKVEDVLNVGDKTWVKFTGIDEKGRWNISRKDALRERGEA